MLFLFFVYRIISIERNDRGLFLRWLNDPNFARIANRDLNLASRTLRYERAPLVKKSEIWRPRFFFALLSTWPKNKTHYRQPWRRSSSGRCNGRNRVLNDDEQKNKGEEMSEDSGWWLWKNKWITSARWRRTTSREADEETDGGGEKWEKRVVYRTAEDWRETASNRSTPLPQLLWLN